MIFNTENQQYKPTQYESFVEYKENSIVDDFKKVVESFNPDIIFWSALSSHIHGEGEYVNIQYGDLLVGKINTTAKRIAGGLQPTADPEGAASRFSNIDFFIRGHLFT